MGLRSSYSYPRYVITRVLPDGIKQLDCSDGRTRRVRFLECVECSRSLPEFAYEAFRGLAPIGSAGGYVPVCKDCLYEAETSRQAQEAARNAKTARTESAKEAAARRYAALRAASPVWRDKEKIAEIYEEARRISHTTGIPHHVDHRMPLQNKLHCGLHVHWNLQILPAYENRSKGNKVRLAA